MATSDIKSYATSTVDFYALLLLPSNFSQKDLDRAWRKAALKYHPDKNPGDASAGEKFHLANIAYDVFNDPSTRALYDGAREAREKKRKADALMQERRRKLKQDLEGRERGEGVKRVWAEVGEAPELEEEAKLEAEVRRIAEDGKRRRLERDEMLRREMERQEGEIARKERTAAEERAKVQAVGGVVELDRSVRVRFRCQDGNNNLSPDTLRKLFDTFGPVESTFLMKNKRERVGGSKEKILLGRGVIVFKSIVGAHTAIEDWTKENVRSIAGNTGWSIVEDVSWASGREPDCLASIQLPMKNQRSAILSAASTGTGQAPTHGASCSDSTSMPSTPKRNVDEFLRTPLKTPSSVADSGPGLRKIPSFASFSINGKDALRRSPLSDEFAAAAAAGGSPSFEELTMMRLKNAEKRRLEAGG